MSPKDNDKEQERKKVKCKETWKESQGKERNTKTVRAKGKDNATTSTRKRHKNNLWTKRPVKDGRDTNKKRIEKGHWIHKVRQSMRSADINLSTTLTWTMACFPLRFVYWVQAAELIFGISPSGFCRVETASSCQFFCIVFTRVRSWRTLFGVAKIYVLYTCIYTYTYIDICKCIVYI